MSYRRRTRPDGNQAEVVAALRAVGLYCWIIGEPVDLLVYVPREDRWQALEVKMRKGKRSDQEAQETLIEELKIPRVTTSEEALKALRMI